jgi:hypothetical protein
LVCSLSPSASAGDIAIYIGGAMHDASEYLLSNDEKPDWLTYPAGMIDLVRAGTDLTPWHLIKADSALRSYEVLQARLHRDLIPFAHRQDREDLACFERGKGEQVLLIHDNTGAGWEDEGRFETFLEWLADAKQEAESWDD